MIDSHAHLEFGLYDVDREEVLLRAQNAGVQTIINIGSADGVNSLRAAQCLAEQRDWIYFTTGIHPHSASAFKE
jgi:TatD DNase family protein